MGLAGNQLNVKLAFCDTMEMVEIEQEVTDYLVHALELSDRPPAGMAYCRLATGCITHNLHFREYGEWPNFDEPGRHPSLAATISRVKDSLERQTGEVLFSINAQSRGSLHWDFETRAGGAKGRHVKTVVGMISNTFTDVFGIGLSLSGIENSEGELDVGELDDAQVLLESVEDERVGLGPWDCMRLGGRANLHGRTFQAEGYYREALRLFLESGDRQGEGASLGSLGNIARKRGELAEAERLYEESLAIDREVGNRGGEAASLNNLGLIARKRGDLKEAERLYGESLAIQREIGDRQGEATSLGNLGNIAGTRGELAEAERLYRDSVRIMNEIGIPLDDWYTENGYTDPDAEWDFPPGNDG